MVEELSPADAGEVLTLQRAAYADQAQVHEDPHLPPLVQTLDEVRDELGRASTRAWGVRERDGRERGRLLGAVRVALDGPAARLGRLTVVPDRQGEGLGTRLLRHAEASVPEVDVVELFTGEHSAGNLRLYRRHGYRETHRSSAGHYDLVHLEKRVGRPVRRARPGDRDAVVALLDERAAWMHRRGVVDQWPSPYPPALIEPRLGAGTTWLVGDDGGDGHGGRPAATFVVDRDGELWGDGRRDAAYLHQFAVRPDRAGLGAAILERLCAQLAAAGVAVLRLDHVAGNERLGDYYVHAGFVPRGLRTVHAVPGDGWPPGASARVRLVELDLTARP